MDRKIEASALCCERIRRITLGISMLLQGIRWDFAQKSDSPKVTAAQIPQIFLDTVLRWCYYHLLHT